MEIQFRPRGTSFAPQAFAREHVRRKDGTRDALDNSDGTTDSVVAGLDRRRRWQLDTPAALSRVGRIDSSIRHRSTSRSLMVLVFPTERS